jgi:glucosylceramidase
MLLATGFVNPDGSVAVVVMNETSHAGDYHLRVGNAAITVHTPPHSIQTVVF